MTEALIDKFKRWSAIEGDAILDDGSVGLVLYLARKVYNDYEPAALQPFLPRLEAWLNNCSSEEEQKVLLGLLSQTFFAGRREFESLYRSALTNIHRWISDKCGLDIGDAKLDEKVQASLLNTWICPITDSLRINSFLKVNGLTGHDHRPHWRSLSLFGDVTKIQNYMADRKIERIVLVEDFVGTGTQIQKTVEFAHSQFPSIELAICPLLICPDGHQALKKLESKHKRLSYLPTLVLPQEAFLKPKTNLGEPPLFARARALIQRQTMFRDAFGYKDTGALVVLFSNCPDNTIALLREKNASWTPLFPRVWRPE